MLRNVFAYFGVCDLINWMKTRLNKMTMPSDTAPVQSVGFDEWVEKYMYLMEYLLIQVVHYVSCCI